MNTRKRLAPIFMALTNWLPAFGRSTRLRGWLLSKLLKSCGKNLRTNAFVNVYNPGRLVVGDNVYLSHGVYIGDGDIVLEDEVMIGPYSVLVGGNHKFRGGSVRYGGYEYHPIRIGRGTWLGGHVSVLPGVTIGESCTIAAGAVVTKDIPPRSVAAGVPARVIAENDPESGANAVNQHGVKS